ncbi:carbohydrate kinase [Salipaludibacillus daqingensis]|uniref:carbohydrate kinase n=1 Tax=Salipaludibacillus daqingensis TaxID=3041001 RepID=UPI0024737A43|nr:winged helix-turn-helix transcriptional regulator [Salipaludibacillus daqingensis]
MNAKEQMIYELIRNNPYITQLELSERLNISRSAIAGYISSLTRSGDIVGRAYVLNEGKKILCVGGANIDRKAKLDQDFKWRDSNPVYVTESVGGVARNVAENLSRLHVSTSLFTATGYDQESEKMWLGSSMIDRSASLQKHGERTGSYTAVLDAENEMMFALADMDIYDSITLDDLNKVASHIRTASILILDTNFPENVLQEIIQNKRKEQLLAVVPVSAKKINRLPENLSNVDYLILNNDELDALVERFSINSALDVKEKMLELKKHGVKNIIVTLGKKGVYYVTKVEEGFIEAVPAKVKDVTGAGDAFAAGFFYATFHEKTVLEACKHGLCLAKFTLETNDSVAKNLDETVFDL